MQQQQQTNMKHCGEPSDVWQLQTPAAGLTDDKELKMARLQCHEEMKNLMTNNNNRKEQEKKQARSKQRGDAATTTNKDEHHCGEPSDVWQPQTPAAGWTDDKELKMARLQCHEEMKNLMTNKSNNKEQHKDSRNMTTTEEQQGGEETSKEQTNRCSNKEHKDSRNMTTR